MRREGRLHGMVRTYQILPLSSSPSRTINVLDSTPTAGIFTKVNPSNPTNHSKFTGKCEKARCSECHLHPSCKSSEKTKGSYKVKVKNDDVSRLKLLSWRVVDSPRPGLGMSFGSSSASEILAHQEEEVDEDGVDFDQEMEMEADGGDGIEVGEEKEVDGGDDEYETMRFCDVGYFWEQVEGDDGWCLVAEK